MKISFDVPDARSAYKMAIMYMLLIESYRSSHDFMMVEDGDSIVGVLGELDDILNEGTYLAGDIDGEHHYDIFGAEVTSKERIAYLDRRWYAKKLKGDDND